MKYLNTTSKIKGRDSSLPLIIITLRFIRIYCTISIITIVPDTTITSFKLLKVTAAKTTVSSTHITTYYQLYFQLHHIIKKPCSVYSTPWNYPMGCHLFLAQEGGSGFLVSELTINPFSFYGLYYLLKTIPRGMLQMLITSSWVILALIASCLMKRT